MKQFGRFKSSFIKIYDNILTKEECEIIISRFEKLNNTEARMLRDDKVVIDSNIKQCREIRGISLYNPIEIHKPLSNIIRPKLRQCFEKYTEEYEFMKSYIASYEYCDTYNIQKYKTEDDGYKFWHCEHGPHHEAATRILAWTFYLNNAQSGTEFMYYPTVDARMGRCVIWPAAFTHLHRSELPNKGLKYIATGWISFK